MMRNGTPHMASCPAIIKPVGPAPTMSTLVWTLIPISSEILYIYVPVWPLLHFGSPRYQSVLSDLYPFSNLDTEGAPIYCRRRRCFLLCLRCFEANRRPQSLQKGE